MQLLNCKKFDKSIILLSLLYRTSIVLLTLEDLLSCIIVLQVAKYIILLSYWVNLTNFLVD